MAWAADSAGNRKDQTVRLGMKSGLHLMYLVSAPFVLEFPGEDFTFGLVYGSGDLQATTSSTTGSSSSGYATQTHTDVLTFTTTELTGRYYIGNSFNIPFGVAMYNLHDDNWEYSSTATYELDYSITQFNVGIGNEWTYDWGGYLGIDWFQGGSKLSEKASATLVSGTESSTSKAKAETTSTEVQAFAGVFIFTFGFGF
ncbi:MAG: hypothetical protein MK515_00060 [SAR324 cluster bacterium]|nr:hypothetical protein [SAR324 cluster bacterium]